MRRSGVHGRGGPIRPCADGGNRLVRHDRALHPPGSRSQTMSESTGRASIFLASVSGGLVALGLMATAARIGTAFYPLALTLLPTLVFVGIVTFDRVVQNGLEDLGYANRIARLRGFYFEPELEAYLLSAPPERRLAIQGLPELVAPLSDGLRSGGVDLPQRAEPFAQLGGVQLRLLPGGEVPALFELVVVDEVGVRLLGPAPRRVDDVVGEDAHGNWNGDVPDGGPAGLVFPVDTRRRDPGVRQPEHGGVVEDVVTRQASFAPFDEGGGDQCLVADRDVVDQPGRQGDG